ncbi:hypothetical protein EIP86_008190 [Pleurotus ostreatoroseus]|nr:hypothetical protein EIP86_008190 [Pleurotus ostreatoroseus]
MLARLSLASLALVLLASGAAARTAARDVVQIRDFFSLQSVTQSCVGSTSAGSCACPTNNLGETGVLINTYPGYQCAYPGGACTWDDSTGELQNPQQTNCPAEAPCNVVAGCACPRDNNGDAGVLINQFSGYECMYLAGPCTWNSNGELVNSNPGACPLNAKCTAPASTAP